MRTRKPQVTDRVHFQLSKTENARKHHTVEVAVNTLGNDFPKTPPVYLEVVELDGTKRAGGYVDRQELVNLGRWLVDQFDAQGGDR